MLIDRCSAAAEMITAFLADGDQPGRHGLSLEELAGFTEDVRIERPGQSPVGTDQDQTNPFDRSGLHQGMVNATGAGDHVLEDLL